MKEIVYTKNAPDPVGPYSQAILTNNTLFISGQVALDPNTGNMINSSIEEETIQVMNNLKAILNKVGFDFSNVIKSTIYLSDMDNFSKVNEVYGSFFNKDYVPSRVTVEVSRLPKDANVEIDMIAS
ncbi:MAG: reactive intermediate/imine deaminase [Flavobacteriaceae bacterium]|jgi:2-iminobutanoate/2-iminopropanoate deaminase|nr:reactive intermediate/imine deaminase [Flavobacteriaceae bacterium]|tara:strand:+ start:1551 stop:1928 length:378 start_codon:yes stop_codon:yes gene_type:complete